MYEREFPEDKKDKSMKEIMLEMSEKLDGVNKKKDKKFRLPMKAKVSKTKLKKDYITVIQVNENKNIVFTKKPIEDGTFKLDNTWHAIREKDIFLHKGKPIIIQPKNKNNPINPLEGEHQTYGQEYVAARIFKDQIKKGTKISGGIILILLAVGVAIYFFTKGGI